MKDDLWFLAIFLAASCLYPYAWVKAIDLIEYVSSKIKSRQQTPRSDEAESKRD